MYLNIEAKKKDQVIAGNRTSAGDLSACAASVGGAVLPTTLPRASHPLQGYPPFRCSVLGERFTGTVVLDKEQVRLLLPLNFYSGCINIGCCSTFSKLSPSAGI